MLSEDARFFGKIALSSFVTSEVLATWITSNMDPGPTTTDWIFSALLVGPVLFFAVVVVVGAIVGVVATLKYPR